MSVFKAPTLTELLEKASSEHGDKTFLKFIRNGKIEERSYDRVFADSRAVCRRLRSVYKGKLHIALAAKTNYEYLICVTGILMSGNTAVPFSPDISASEAVKLFTDADIDIVLYDEAFEDKLPEVKKNCGRIKHCIDLTDYSFFEETYREYSDSSEYAALSEVDIDPDDCAVIIYTSGTTGVRKGVMLSMNALVGNIMYHDYCRIFNPEEAALSVLPMHHIYCFSGDFIKNLKDGVQVCLNESLKDIVKNLNLFEPETMRVVPMIARSLLQLVKSTAVRQDLTLQQAKEKIFGKNLKWLISGGAYLSPELTEEYDELGIFLRQGYGMTEAGCRISVPDEQASADSVGRVIDICRVRTQDGEIQVKTPTVMLGYYKQPEETAKMFTPDGWLKTGDLGYVTDDGQLFITGRVKNLIILSGGENVSPEAIEKKFKGYPLVEEIMVYAENDRIVAEVYPDQKYACLNGIEDIKGEIERKTDEMNSGAKPSHFISEVRLRPDPFPKTHSGKIKRRKAIIK